MNESVILEGIEWEGEVPVLVEILWINKVYYKVKGYRIDYGEEGVYIVFDLKVKKIFRERPKKGEEPVDENGNVIKTPVDRKGYFPDDIARLDPNAVFV